MTSGGASSKMRNATSKRPRKSGTKISILMPGEAARIALMQSTKCCEPPSGKSSLSTLVMTT